MKIISFILFLLNCVLPLVAQTEYVDINNRVYRFLERMENHGIISDYNSFELPKTRKETANYIKKVIENDSLLSITDKDILKDLVIEFEYELYRTTDNSLSIINNNGYNYFDEKQKYLFFSTAENFDIFINLFTEIVYIHNYKKDIFNNNAVTGNIGGIIRGNIYDKFGFLIKGTNGKVFGSRRAAISKVSLAQSFKLSERPDDGFFDETEGYITADFDIIKFKLGRERIKIGYGDIAIVDDYSPVFDYISMSLNYKFFSYSFFHAKMLDINTAADYPFVSDKFLVYHRIGFNTGRHFDFGMGEFLIYGRRGIDISYLNPFAFYKSIEHSNRDRDNAMLFFDINNNSIPGTKLYLTCLVDDIAYSKLGTGWYGNQVMLNAGFISSDIAGMSADISGNYRRTEPYTFSHRLSQNSFTNYGYSLSPFSLPNSELFSGSINYRFNNRVEISSGLVFMIHGANPVSDDGITNVGGDIFLGYRVNDSENAEFLAGIREYYRQYYLSVFFEPVNEIQFRVNLKYLNNSTQTEESQKEIQTFFTLTTIF